MAKKVRMNVKTAEGYDVLHPETEAGQILMTEYAKPAWGGAVSELDTASTAIGKLEKGVEDSIPKSDIVQLRGRSETKVMSQRAVTDAIDAGGGGGGTGDAEPVGAMKPFAGEELPDGYLWCDGASYPANGDYLELYRVIGATYNAPGDAEGTFRVPDLKGRVAVGKDAGTFDALGGKGGEETQAYGLENGYAAAVLANASADNFAIKRKTGVGQWNSNLTATISSVKTPAVDNTAGIALGGTTGEGNNLQPYLVCNYIIKYGKSYGEIGVTAPPCIWEFAASDWQAADGGGYALSIPEGEHRRGEHCVLTALYDTSEEGVMKSLLSENEKDAAGNITVYSDTAFTGKAYIDRVYMVAAGRVLSVNGQGPDVDGDVKTGIPSNRNLLINGDFQVWQRGTVFNKTAGYTADRWKVDAQKNTFTVERLNNPRRAHISITNNGMNFGQYLEWDETVKTVTLSYRAKVTNGVHFWGGCYYEGYAGMKEFVGTGTWETYITTFDTLAESKLWIMPFWTGAGISDATMDAECEWIKLEYGKMATPFVPRLYQEELMLCERYFEIIVQGNKDLQVPCSGWSAQAAHASGRYKVQKRITNPTVVLYNASVLGRIVYYTPSGWTPGTRNVSEITALPGTTGQWYHIRFGFASGGDLPLTITRCEYDCANGSSNFILGIDAEIY